MGQHNLVSDAICEFNIIYIFMHLEDTVIQRDLIRGILVTGLCFPCMNP